MDDRYLLALRIQGYQRSLKEGTLDEDAREVVNELLAKAQSELAALRRPPRKQ